MMLTKLQKESYDSKPAYLRLGRSSLSLKCNDLNYSYNIIENNNSSTTIIGLGPMLEKIILATRRKKLNNLLNIIGCFKLPLVENDEIIKILESTNNLIIVEDHVEIGGLSQQISSFILKNKIMITNFINMSAKDYPSDLYGNEDFHHLDSKISIGDIEENILRILNSLLRILVISQYFYPENFRINDLCMSLKKRGHEISVLTGKPNYPKGEYFEGYSWNTKSFETIKGIDVYRSNLF